MALRRPFAAGRAVSIARTATDVRSGAKTPVAGMIHAITLLLVLLVAAPVAASDRYALIVSGANGEPVYADQYGQWRQQTVTVLLEKLGFEMIRTNAISVRGHVAHRPRG